LSSPLGYCLFLFVPLVVGRVEVIDIVTIKVHRLALEK